MLIIKLIYSISNLIYGMVLFLWYININDMVILNKAFRDGNSSKFNTCIAPLFKMKDTINIDDI